MLPHRIVIAIALFLCSSLAEKAAGQSGATDSMFRRVIRFMEAKQPDSIYALTNEGFKAKVPKAAFDNASYQLQQLGKLQESSFLERKDEIGFYKLVYSSATLQMLLGVDSAGSIRTLVFQPFQPPVKDKNYSVASTNKVSTTFDRAIDSIARGYIQKEHTVGMSIGILKGDAVTTYGYGSTAKSNGSIPNEHTVYEIGSVTKTFTSLLLAYYVTIGIVSMDDPITNYLPDSVGKNVNLKDVLIKHLSNHTSGLARMPDNFFMYVTDSLNPYKDYDVAQLYDYLEVAILATTPGEQYAYSNLGMGLLGRILQNASGKTYESMLKLVITGPLKMKSTFAALPPAIKKRMTTVHNSDGKETPAWDFKVFAPAGGLRSTVHDLLLYAKANMNPADDRLGKATTLTHQVTFDKGTTIGMGWHIIEVKGTKVYVHTGATNGSSSIVLFEPRQKMAVVVLSNASASVREAGMKVMAAVL